nr:hypothetical protein [Tanacetum cinerariifolium]
MLNKDNYVPWSSRIIRYARSRPNGKIIVDSIENGPYVRRMIATPGEPDLPVPVTESLHEQTDEELIETDIKRMDADDQAIQTILLGLPEDVYAAVDSCEIAKEIWEQNIASNLKFLNNFQPEWKRHVTIVRQTKNLHEADFTQIYDFLKMNQEEVNELRAERLVKSHDPLALMAHSQNSLNIPTTHKDQSSSRIANQSRTGNVVASRAEGTGIGNQASDLDEIEEVNANCILMANLQQASTSGTQHDRAPVYDTDGSAEYTDLLEPIPEPPLVPQNDNHVNSVAPSMVHSGGTVETSSAPNEEIRTHQETVYRNLVYQVAQVNRVNSNMRGTNAELKSELARYKIQEQRVEISQEKYDKLEKCYQKEEKKKLKHDFKTQEDKFLDKEVDLEARIKDLENILLKRDQTVQTMHMLNPKPDSFYYLNKKMALGYPNPLYLKKAQLKQQSLYNGNVLLKEHDPPAVYDSEEMKQEVKRIEEEQAASARYWKIPACCDDDDDYDYAITPVLSTEETKNTLSIGDEHLDTIPATESDEVIKSCVEDLVPIP